MIHTYTCAICGFETNDPAEASAHQVDKHPVVEPPGLLPAILRDGKLTDGQELLADHLTRLLGGEAPHD